MRIIHPAVDAPPVSMNWHSSDVDSRRTFRLGLGWRRGDQFVGFFVESEFEPTELIAIDHAWKGRKAVGGSECVITSRARRWHIAGDR